ncbi:MAG: nucleotide exchange factor GrpE [Chloroflexi bacterium]|nr:nucleotide exchange factor GrpE [Chloroflexota bacterium]
MADKAAPNHDQEPRASMPAETQPEAEGPPAPASSEETAAQETAAVESSHPEEKAEGTMREIESLKQELEKAREQAQEYLEGWQRSLAEFDNYRKRVAQQEEATRQRLKAEVLKPFLDVLDDIDLALANRPSIEDPSTKWAEWATGVELIFQKLQNALYSQGLEPIEPQVGDPFDPFEHEAVAAEPSDEVESNHILEVLRKGYRVGQVLLRPALVKVAQ